MRSASVHVVPSGLTLMRRSASPASPISARPEKADWKRIEGAGVGFLVHRVAQVAGAAFARRQRRPQRTVQLRGEPVERIGRGADAETGQVLEQVQRFRQRFPERAGPDREPRLVRDEGGPADARLEDLPGAVDEGRHLPRMVGPDAGRGGTDDVARARRGFCRRGRQGGGFDRKLDEGIQHAQCLVVRDMLLGLARHDVGKGQVGGRFHGRLASHRSPPS